MPFPERAPSGAIPVTAAAWVSPLPRQVCGKVRTFRPGTDVRQVAAVIVERAWLGRGVRVWCWPDRTVALSTAHSTMDLMLLQLCPEQLLGTWCKGAMEAHVLATLHWARAHP